MVVLTYDDVLSQAQQLTPENQLRLLEALASSIRQAGLLSVQATQGKTPVPVRPSSEHYDPTTDPLMQLAGSISSGDPSWAERHDEYLAESYMEEHDGEQ